MPHSVCSAILPECTWRTAATIVAVLLVMGLVISRSKKSKWTARRLSYAAMCIAIAFVLSCIKLYHAPQGGCHNARRDAAADHVRARVRSRSGPDRRPAHTVCSN